MKGVWSHCTHFSLAVSQLVYPIYSLEIAKKKNSFYIKKIKPTRKTQNNVTNKYIPENKTELKIIVNMFKIISLRGHLKRELLPCWKIFMVATFKIIYVNWKHAFWKQISEAAYTYIYITMRTHTHLHVIKISKLILNYRNNLQSYLVVIVLFLFFETGHVLYNSWFYLIFYGKHLLHNNKVKTCKLFCTLLNKNS